MEKVFSFVDVRHLFVEYPAKTSLLGKLAGQAGAGYSVLRDINFALAQGSQVTLFGVSGAGKTTLLRVLAGGIKPSRGQGILNGQKFADQARSLAAGYVSSEESEPAVGTVNEVLHTFGAANNVSHLPAKIGAVSEALHIRPLLFRPARALSSTERLRLNIARALLSDCPLVLLDDVADELGVEEIRDLLAGPLAGRTVIIATRFPATAEQLNLPMLLLHQATLVHSGRREEIANTLACPRVIEVWVEGLRYDLLRRLRNQPGILDVRLLHSTSFSGQRLRITLQSARYLPLTYDLLSQAPLIKVEELPASLTDILSRL